MAPVVGSERKKDVVKASDDVMGALGLARPRWAAASELAIPVGRCRTFPDLRAVRAAAIGATFLCQTAAATGNDAIPLKSARCCFLYLARTPCISLS